MWSGGSADWASKKSIAEIVVGRVKMKRDELPLVLRRRLHIFMRLLVWWV
ncbi:MAG: hypothetical protein ACKESB_00605 [Candidatus Hodgkinia cicadicola]